MAVSELEKKAERKIRNISRANKAPVEASFNAARPLLPWDEHVEVLFFGWQAPATGLLQGSYR
jgi:hypothetical protein